MKETIKALETKQEQLRKELDKVETAIDALRDVCDHKSKDGKTKFEWVGNDSHYDYEKCTICGIDRKV